MWEHLTKQPAELAAHLAMELVRRAKTLNTGDLAQLRATLDQAIHIADYATRARSLLAQPLKLRNQEVDGTNWQDAGIRLLALWKKTTPEAVRARMAELQARDKEKWNQVFPDEWDIDEGKLDQFYRELEPFQANGMHNLNAMCLAIRWHVAEVLAPIAGENGAFDLGGSDGMTTLFLHHHGARGVTLIEPNDHSRGFGQWLADQLGFVGMKFADRCAPAEQYAAGVCTEVLEHVVDPPATVRYLYDLLKPGGVIFVTATFVASQATHLKQNLRYHGKEHELMRAAGFVPWNPPVRCPLPFLAHWGYWQKPAREGLSKAA
jgi:hypothetical protein